MAAFFIFRPAAAIHTIRAVPRGTESGTDKPFRLSTLGLSVPFFEKCVTCFTAAARASRMIGLSKNKPAEQAVEEYTKRFRRKQSFYL